MRPVFQLADDSLYSHFEALVEPAGSLRIYAKRYEYGHYSLVLRDGDDGLVIGFRSERGNLEGPSAGGA